MSFRPPAISHDRQSSASSNTSTHTHASVASLHSLVQPPQERRLYPGRFAAAAAQLHHQQQSHRADTPNNHNEEDDHDESEGDEEEEEEDDEDEDEEEQEEDDDQSSESDPQVGAAQMRSLQAQLARYNLAHLSAPASRPASSVSAAVQERQSRFRSSFSSASGSSASMYQPPAEVRTWSDMQPSRRHRYHGDEKESEEEPEEEEEDEEEEDAPSIASSAAAIGRRAEYVSLSNVNVPSILDPSSSSSALALSPSHQHALSSSASTPHAGSSAHALTSLLQCYICYSRLRDPHMCSSCSKIGCLSCYKRWIEERGNNSCPHCRTKLSLKSGLVKARFVKDLESAMIEAGMIVQDGAPKVASLPSTGANSSTCSVHTANSLVYFCLTCSTSICSDCALFTPTHKSHEFAKLDDIYREHVSLVAVELKQIEKRREKMVASTRTLEEGLTKLTKRRDELTAHYANVLRDVEHTMGETLTRKMKRLEEMKKSVETESHHLSRLLSDVTTQLNPIVTPRHVFIRTTSELIHRLYEVHAKKMLFEEEDEKEESESKEEEEAKANGAPHSAVSSDSTSSSYSLHGPSELIPEFYASPLVIIHDFAEKRNTAIREEQELQKRREEYIEDVERRQRIAKEEAEEKMVAAAAADSNETDPSPASEVIPPLLPPPPASAAPSSSPSAEVYYSSPMHVNGQSWRLKAYPNGNSGIAKGMYLSVFVELTKSEIGESNHTADGEEDFDADETEEKNDHGIDEENEPYLRSLPSSHHPPIPSPPNLNKYEYRVELLPHPRCFRGLERVLTLQTLKDLKHGTVSEFVDHLMYKHAANSDLVQVLQTYAAKIVTRVFASNFERAESWGYNRFFRLEILKEEGYMESTDSEESEKATKSSSASASSSSAPPTSSSSTATITNGIADSFDSSHDASSGDLLFKYYIRPPSYYLQSFEQRAWIRELERVTKEQRKMIVELTQEKRGGRKMDHEIDRINNNRHSSSPTANLVSPNPMYSKEADRKLMLRDLISSAVNLVVPVQPNKPKEPICSMPIAIPHGSATSAFTHDTHRFRGATASSHSSSSSSSSSSGSAASSSRSSPSLPTILSSPILPVVNVGNPTAITRGLTHTSHGVTSSNGVASSHHTTTTTIAASSTIPPSQQQAAPSQSLAQLLSASRSASVSSNDSYTHEEHAAHARIHALANAYAPKDGQNGQSQSEHASEEEDGEEQVAAAEEEDEEDTAAELANILARTNATHRKEVQVNQATGANNNNHASSVSSSSHRPRHPMQPLPRTMNETEMTEHHS